MILDTIESNDIHAVVMGTTGRRGSDRILLGNVAEKDCPLSAGSRHHS